jgi:hypothetical protein
MVAGLRPATEGNSAVFADYPSAAFPAIHPVSRRARYLIPPNPLCVWRLVFRLHPTVLALANVSSINLPRTGFES